MGDAPTWADFVGALSLFRDPILCGVVAGAVLGYLGVFIVLWRMVFVTAALTQSAGLGVALGLWVSIQFGVHVHPVIGALAACLAAAALMALRAERLRLSREAIMAVVWLAAGGGALLVGTRIAHEAHSVAGILFGSAVLVRPEDLWLVVGVGSVVLGVTLWFQKGLVLAGFDPDGARVQGVPVRLLEVGFLVLVTLVVAVCTRALGALPVFAFSVLPGMAALLVTPRLKLVFPLALLFGAIAGGVGYMLAFFASFPVGASQTAVAVLLVLLAIPIRLLSRTD
jgi:zinc transport system permease protein